MIKLFENTRSPRGDKYDYIIRFCKDTKSKPFLIHWSKAISHIDKVIDLEHKLYRTNQDGINYLKRVEMEMNNSKHSHDFETCMEAIQNPIFGNNSVANKIREFYNKNKSRLNEEFKNIRENSPEYKKKNNAEFIIENVNKKSITDYDNMGSHLKCEPYVYQKEIIKFCLENEHVLIVAPCGAGKTPMVLGIFDEAKRAGKIKGPGIIVVKASLKNQWKEEVKKFTDYKAIIVNTLAKMKKDQQAFKDQFKDNDLYILNYEALRDERIRKEMKKVNADFMACDEIQYIKEYTTKRSRAVYEFNDIKFRIGATATPVMKNPLDIFGIFKFIDHNLFPKMTQFKYRYADIDYIPTRNGNRAEKVKGAKNEVELNSKISPYMIIKTKREVSEHLPDLQIIRRSCHFTPKQQRMNDKIMQYIDDLHQEEYNIIKRLAVAGAETSDELESIKGRVMMYQTFAQMLAVDEKLLMYSDSNKSKEFITGGASDKMATMLELVKEIIDSGEKVTIFSRFVDTETIIKDLIKHDKELEGCKIAVVNGSLNSEKRYVELYDKFRDDPDYKILICTDAAAEGVNLSKCRYLIELDLAQSYALQTQRHGRIERADSVHDTVYVYQLICENSYDDIAIKIINKKEGFDKSIVKGEIPESK